MTAAYVVLGTALLRTLIGSTRWGAWRIIADPPII